MIQFTCPQCGRQTSAPEHLAGLRTTCAACRQTVRVPRYFPHATEGESAVQETPHHHGHGHGHGHGHDHAHSDDHGDTHDHDHGHLHDHDDSVAHSHPHTHHDHGREFTHTHDHHHTHGQIHDHDHVHDHDDDFGTPLTPAASTPPADTVETLIAELRAERQVRARLEARLKQVEKELHDAQRSADESAHSASSTRLQLASLSMHAEAAAPEKPDFAGLEVWFAEARLRADDAAGTLAPATVADTLSVISRLTEDDATDRLRSAKAALDAAEARAAYNSGQVKRLTEELASARAEQMHTAARLRELEERLHRTESRMEAGDFDMDGAAVPFADPFTPPLNLGLDDHYPLTSNAGAGVGLLEPSPISPPGSSGAEVDLAVDDVDFLPDQVPAQTIDDYAVYPRESSLDALPLQAADDAIVEKLPEDARLSLEREPFEFTPTVAPPTFNEAEFDAAFRVDSVEVQSPANALASLESALEAWGSLGIGDIPVFTEPGDAHIGPPEPDLATAEVPPVHLPVETPAVAESTQIPLSELEQALTVWGGFAEFGEMEGAAAPERPAKPEVTTTATDLLVDQVPEVLHSAAIEGAPARDSALEETAAGEQHFTFSETTPAPCMDADAAISDFVPDQEPERFAEPAPSVAPVAPDGSGPATGLHDALEAFGEGERAILDQIMQPETGQETGSATPESETITSEDEAWEAPGESVWSTTDENVPPDSFAAETGLGTEDEPTADVAFEPEIKEQALILATTELAPETGDAFTIAGLETAPVFDEFDAESEPESAPVDLAIQAEVAQELDWNVARTEETSEERAPLEDFEPPTGLAPGPALAESAAEPEPEPDAEPRSTPAEPEIESPPESGEDEAQPAPEGEMVRSGTEQETTTGDLPVEPDQTPPTDSVMDSVEVASEFVPEPEIGAAEPAQETFAEAAAPDAGPEPEVVTPVQETFGEAVAQVDETEPESTREPESDAVEPAQETYAEAVAQAIEAIEPEPTPAPKIEPKPESEAEPDEFIPESDATPEPLPDLAALLSARQAAVQEIEEPALDQRDFSVAPPAAEAVIPISAETPVRPAARFGDLQKKRAETAKGAKTMVNALKAWGGLEPPAAAPTASAVPVEDTAEQLPAPVPELQQQDKGKAGKSVMVDSLMRFMGS